MRVRAKAFALLLLVACGDDDSAMDAAAPMDAPGTDAGSDVADGGTDAAEIDAGADAGNDAASPALVSLRFYRVSAERVDARFETLPASIPWVQVLPDVTLVADVPEETVSVRWTVDGETRVDEEAPFRWGEEEDGSPSAWNLAGPETHTIRVVAFSGAGAGASALADEEFELVLTGQGMDATPDEGEHGVHRLWLTGSDQYVHRDDEGNFVNADGEEVLGADEVELRVEGDDEGHLVADEGAGDTLDFAFIVLLPDGFDPDVEYPLLVFLHHGWAVYRGTDNDGRPLNTPLFNGSQSIVRSGYRTRFPAVILVPQMVRRVERDGVSHEWAAFTSIDGSAGTSNSAPEPSDNALPVLRVVDELVASTLPVNGMTTSIDETRLYIAGHSMGGLGTWDLIGREPAKWAAAVPMAGYPDHQRAEVLVDTPIWAFHHRIDCFNAFAGTETMHRRITEEFGGTQMRFTAQDFDTDGQCDQAHFQTPNFAWDTEGVMEWLFRQAL